MTDPLFLEDAYLFAADGVVMAVTDDGGVILDASIFYAAGGGQPGDVGRLTWAGQEMPIATAIKGEAGAIVLVPAPGAAIPPVGAVVRQELDEATRMAHMKMHTGLHLLSVVIPLPVTGGQIGALKGRLDFDMPEAPEDKDAIEAALNALIAADLPVSYEWITDAELDANPGLVKTLRVQPPRGSGRVRLVRIGEGAAQIDLQPCGGTHVRTTGEIGRMRLGKIEKKGKQNRRVSIHLD